MSIIIAQQYKKLSTPRLDRSHRHCQLLNTKSVDENAHWLWHNQKRTKNQHQDFTINIIIFILIVIMLASFRFTRALSSSSSSSLSLSYSSFVGASRAASRAFSSAVTTMDAAVHTPESLMENFLQQQQQQQTSFTGNAVAEAMYALYKADAVCFDVDSTVIAEEGIDVLADYLGKGEEVAALTRKAMEGGMKFQDALQLRLDLLQPSRQSILQLLKEQPLQLTPGVDTLMATLQQKQVDIWLVSGGFRIMIEPVATSLKIPTSNIVANTILFDDDTTEGKYKGFDPKEPTSADMGKPKALQQLQDKHSYSTMVMVGDGATDAQAKPPAKAFIGFGGVIERQAVKEKADWFVTDFADMVQIVQMRD
jgi:phosphoserine phosphatase